MEVITLPETLSFIKFHTFAVIVKPKNVMRVKAYNL